MIEKLAVKICDEAEWSCDTNGGDNYATILSNKPSP
jgi:hypothetical protein